MGPPGNLNETVSGAVLTENEAEVLRELRGLHRVDPSRFWRPLDFGGHDASHHSGTATRLVKRGLVERRDRGSLAGIRAVWLYRLGVYGARALTAHDTSTRPAMPREEQSK